jgi:DNA-binding GntR family transcriptional regulator
MLRQPFRGNPMSRASDRAYGHIRNLILSGDLAPGTQLREEQLAESCGVSRTPVRDALRRLEAEAFVRRSVSQRCFVSDYSLAEMEEAFVLRGMLEAHAASRAASRLSWDQIAQLRFANEAIFAAVSAKNPDIPAFLEHNRRFHAIIVDAAKSERLANMLSRLIEQPVLLRTALQYDRENLLRSHHEHQELLAAFERRDQEWARAVMESHIRRAFHAYADAHKQGDALTAKELTA